MQFAILSRAVRGFDVLHVIDHQLGDRGDVLRGRQTEMIDRTTATPL